MNGQQLYDVLNEATSPNDLVDAFQRFFNTQTMCDFSQMFHTALIKAKRQYFVDSSLFDTFSESNSTRCTKKYDELKKMFQKNLKRDRDAKHEKSESRRNGSGTINKSKAPLLQTRPSLPKTILLFSKDLAASQTFAEYKLFMSIKTKLAPAIANENKTWRKQEKTLVEQSQDSRRLLTVEKSLVNKICKMLESTEEDDNCSNSATANGTDCVIVNLPNLDLPVPPPNSPAVIGMTDATTALHDNDHNNSPSASSSSSSLASSCVDTSDEPVSDVVTSTDGDADADADLYPETKFLPMDLFDLINN